MAIIDAKDMVLGRMAAVVAKRAILGEKIEIVNCEKAVISGTRAFTISKYLAAYNRGTPFKGPFFPRDPARFTKRIIRGMIPYRKAHGDAAMRRIFCYSGVPEKLAGKETESIASANVRTTNNTKYTRLSDLTKLMGARQ